MNRHKKKPPLSGRLCLLEGLLYLMAGGVLVSISYSLLLWWRY